MSDHDIMGLTRLLMFLLDIKFSSSAIWKMVVVLLGKVSDAALFYSKDPLLLQYLLVIIDEPVENFHISQSKYIPYVAY